MLVDLKFSQIVNRKLAFYGASYLAIFSASGESLYQILGLKSKSVSDEVVKAQYRKVCRELISTL